MSAAVIKTELPVTAANMARLRESDPDVYAEWVKRYEADPKAVTTIPASSRRLRRNWALIAPRHAPQDKAQRVAFMHKLKSFVSAVTGPKASDATFEQRVAECRRCEHKRDRGEKEYCGACGCPAWKLAELSTKLRFANLECPLGKWSSENANDQTGT
jgi:ribosomal protein L37E